MALTLGYLLKYAKENYDMSILCGYENMNNIVNWVHMLEDPETAHFLHGEELIVTTGIGFDNTDWFFDFVKDLHSNGASGLVLNIGPYIKSVQPELIEYCRSINFPLLTIPWKTRIVDVTNDFCRKIIKSEEDDVSVASAFRGYIFSPHTASEYLPVLSNKGFDTKGQYSLLLISYEVPKSSMQQSYDKRIRQHLISLLIEESDRFSVFGVDRNLVVVLQDFQESVVERVVNNLVEICKYGINTGISENTPGIESLPKNYKRALAMLKLAKKHQKKHVFYNDIELYKLLIEIDDMNVLETFYQNHLGVLQDYDKKNKSDYYDTLKCYLDNNGSVEKVSNIMYVHRNTVNYKIRKIREILGYELDHVESLQMLLAYYIKDLL